MIAQTPATCCNEARWCRTCGGRAYRYMLGAAHCGGALDAERLYHQVKERGAPAEYPVTLAQVARAITPLLEAVDEEDEVVAVEVRRWLIEASWEEGRKRWGELVGR